MRNDNSPSESKWTQPQTQPLFMAMPTGDKSLHNAYERARVTLPKFIDHISSGGTPYCSAKLRFRDSELSERLGENRYVFIWVTSVSFSNEKFSGRFFELPPEIKFAQVGEEVEFTRDSIFDWMVNIDGRLSGGFTLRYQRERLPEKERADFDKYVGVGFYENMD